MKKLALLAGSIGSTAAWYILSNKKLRTELGKAKGPEQTVKILSKYLGRDAEKIGNEVYALVQSGELKEGLEKAKEFSGGALEKAKTGLGGLFAKGKKAAEEALEAAKRKAGK